MQGLIRQFAVIVENLDDSMKYYWENMGIGVFQKNHFTPETSHDIYVRGKKVEGEDYHFCCACCWEGDMEYELIKPYAGSNIYWDHLKEFGPGLHHFKIVIPDNDVLKTYVDSFAEKGMKVIQTGWIDNDVHYYIDSYEQLGMIVEFGNGGSIRATTDLYPAEPNPVRPVAYQQTIRQMGLVVDDLQKYMKNWENIMELSDWKVREISPQLYKGEKADCSYLSAVAEAGGIELELIQPVRGESVYSEFLKNHGVGLFHIKDVTTADALQSEIDRWAKLGVSVIQKAEDDKALTCVLDTQKPLSMVMELEVRK